MEYRTGFAKVRLLPYVFVSITTLVGGRRKKRPVEVSLINELASMDGKEEEEGEERPFLGSIWTHHNGGREGRTRKEDGRGGERRGPFVSLSPIVLPFFLPPSHKTNGIKAGKESQSARRGGKKRKSWDRIKE